MVTIGTPLSSSASKLMLLGSGELGKEVAIEAQRYGVEVIAVDRYDNAPAMQVAHRSYTINMLDGDGLEQLIRSEQPDLIVPEIEAIATDRLLQLEQQGFNVIPTARATSLTMNREGIRRLASEELNLATSQYVFADNQQAYVAAIAKIGLPCVVKPIMSSSGKGQTVVKILEESVHAWHNAQQQGRAGQGRVIVEAFVDFDYEITLLTVRHNQGTSFCQPIGHHQVAGDYRQSWQPHPMTDKALEKAQQIAVTITDALGGWGLFGVEMFVKGDDVYFSEVSPRPHDTGMVTMISQQLSEFALHVRAILGLPIPNIELFGPSASQVILGEGNSSCMCYENIDQALIEPNTMLRLFGKPQVQGERRLGVVLARDDSIEKALAKAQRAEQAVKVEMQPNVVDKSEKVL